MGHKREPAEVFVFRYQDAVFRVGEIHQLAVNRTLLELANGQHVVAGSPQSANSGEVTAFVCKKSHSMSVSRYVVLIRAQRQKFIMRYGVSRVRQTGADIGFREPWISLKQVGYRCTLGKFPQHDFNRNTRAAHHRLAHHH